MGNFARFYTDGSYNRFVVCSCGFCNSSRNFSVWDANTCPNCGTPILFDGGRFNKWSLNHNFVEVDFIENEDTSIHFKKRVVKSTLVLNKDTLIAEDKTTYYRMDVSQVSEIEFKYNTREKDKTKIIIDGQEKKINKTNIQKATSHVTKLKEKSLFDEVQWLYDTTSLASAIEYIDTIPYLESFYTTYGNLRCLDNIGKSCLNRKEVSPVKVLDIHKAVWRHINDLFGEDKMVDGISRSNFNKYFYNVQNLSKSFAPELVNKVIDFSLENNMLIYMGDMHKLLSENYEFDRIVDYITEEVYTLQGISSPKDALTLLRDYVDMSCEMEVEYEKYPKSLKLVHDLTAKNHKFVVDEIKKKKFLDVVSEEDYKYLAYENEKDEYCVIVPNGAEDIVNEGKKLGHCVGSYVNRIVNKDTKIVFMRESNNHDKPLITLEVKDGTLRQYRGRGNRNPSKEEMDFIKKWANKKGIDMVQQSYVPQREVLYA